MTYYWTHYPISKVSPIVFIYRYDGYGIRSASQARQNEEKKNESGERHGKNVYFSHQARRKAHQKMYIFHTKRIERRAEYGAEFFADK